MTTASPAFTFPSMMAVIASSSLSKTRAWPVNFLRLSATPAALTMAPSGRKAAREDREAAPRVVRLVDGSYDPVVLNAGLGHQLSDALSRHRHAPLVHEAFLESSFIIA